VVEDRPILSAEYRLTLLAKTDPPCSGGLSAIAALLVNIQVNSFTDLHYVQNIVYLYCEILFKYRFAVVIAKCLCSGHIGYTVNHKKWQYTL